MFLETLFSGILATTFATTPIQVQSNPNEPPKTIYVPKTIYIKVDNKPYEIKNLSRKPHIRTTYTIKDRKGKFIKPDKYKVMLTEDNKYIILANIQDMRFGVFNVDEITNSTRFMWPNRVKIKRTHDLGHCVITLQDKQNKVVVRSTAKIYFGLNLKTKREAEKESNDN